MPYVLASMGHRKPANGRQPRNSLATNAGIGGTSPRHSPHRLWASLEIARSRVKRSRFPPYSAACSRKQDGKHGPKPQMATARASEDRSTPQQHPNALHTMQSKQKTAVGCPQRRCCPWNTGAEFTRCLVHDVVSKRPPPSVSTHMLAAAHKRSNPRLFPLALPKPCTRTEGCSTA